MELLDHHVNKINVYCTEMQEKYCSLYKNKTEHLQPVSVSVRHRIKRTGALRAG